MPRTANTRPAVEDMLREMGMAHLTKRAAEAGRRAQAAARPA